jgi:hypothetical protein
MQYLRSFLLAFSMASLATTAACSGAHAQNDGESSSGALTDWFRDLGIKDNSPDAIAMLAVVNDRTIDAEAFVSRVGLKVRTAEAIVDTRNGPDGVAGTADDENFESLAEIAAQPGMDTEGATHLRDFARTYHPGSDGGTGGGGTGGGDTGTDAGPGPLSDGGTSGARQATVTFFPGGAWTMTGAIVALGGAVTRFGWPSDVAITFVNHVGQDLHFQCTGVPVFLNTWTLATDGQQTLNGGLVPSGECRDDDGHDVAWVQAQ